MSNQQKKELTNQLQKAGYSAGWIDKVLDFLGAKDELKKQLTKILSKALKDKVPDAILSTIVDAAVDEILDLLP